MIIDALITHRNDESHFLFAKLENFTDFAVNLEYDRNVSFNLNFSAKNRILLQIMNHLERLQGYELLGASSIEHHFLFLQKFYDELLWPQGSISESF